MKTLPTILLLAICIYSPKTFAQTPQCVLRYYYDDSGNRIERAMAGSCYNNSKMDTSISIAPNQGLIEAVFPNPTSGSFTVMFNNSIIQTQISITDNLGRQLYSVVTSGITVPLDISSFAQGIYHIVVRADSSSFENTIVKN